MMHAAWLPIVMQGSFSEIYVMDAATLRIIEANDAACGNLGHDRQALTAMSMPMLARGLDPAPLTHTLDALRTGRLPRAELETAHTRRDGSTYPIELRLFFWKSDAAAPAVAPVFIAIGNDLSARHESDQALRQSEARIHAVVSHMPGMVYQFLRRSDGAVSFPYVSEGCHALLGIGAELLREDAGRFIDLVLPEDRDAYAASMQESAADMRAWNWEGRIWIESWKDIKWINLRATPRALPGLGVQWEGIMTNITQSKLEEAEIKRSREQLVELSTHIDAVKEKERTRIAREIHDDIGGNLTAIKMALSLLARRLPADNTALTEKAAYADALVDRTIEAIHRISMDLRPALLDLGVVAAIEWQSLEFEKQLGIACEFASNVQELDLPPEQATALFRIFQEALTNISKHADATRVSVKLNAGAGNVRLEVADDGRGIAATDRLKTKSFGIRGMVERASALGGNLTVASGVDGGTVVALHIPLPLPAANG